MSEALRVLGIVALALTAGFAGGFLNPAHDGARGPAGPKGDSVKLPRLGVCVEGDFDTGVASVFTPDLQDGVPTCTSGTYVSVRPRPEPARAGG